MGKGILYSIRRKCQVVAQTIFSYKTMSEFYYKIVLKKKLNLDNPKTFNEKLQWLKLYYWPENELAIKCADKYKVRDFLIDSGYADYVNELYYSYDNVEEINWDKLPEKFVLKCNHGCGYNIICNSRSESDINEYKKLLKMWMKEDFSKYNAEPHYSKIKPKIICEKHLGTDIKNYNIFCCNGKPEFFSVIEGLGAGVDEALTYYYADGRKAEFYNSHYPTSKEPLPATLPKMMELATEIAKNFPFVRVDFYEVDGSIIFSELTFTPGGALIQFTPDEYDAKLGEKLDISELVRNYKENKNA